jgi:protein involved in polysaccharide export with SLBB domain
MIAGAMSARNLARIAGGDQGIHNYLLIQKRLPGVTVHPNRHAPVLTMGVMNPGEVRFNAADEVLNENGEVAPVLHQYDRLPEVKQRLLAGLGRRP